MPPKMLSQMQYWFAGAITTPLLEDDDGSGKPVHEGAERYIAPNEKLSAHDRIHIYNEQYWWRLLTVLQETFPCVVGLLGYYTFNQEVGTPYLVAFPPSDWAVTMIGRNLPRWIDAACALPKKILLKDAPALDWAYHAVFFERHARAVSLESLAPDSLPTLSAQTLYLQPHIRLITTDGDIASYRRSLLAYRPEHWEVTERPLYDRTSHYHYVVYQDLQGGVQLETLSDTEMDLFSRFQRGSSIEDLCEYIASMPEIAAEACRSLEGWMQRWVMNRWLTKETDCL